MGDTFLGVAVKSFDYQEQVSKGSGGRFLCPAISVVSTFCNCCLVTGLGDRNNWVGKGFLGNFSSITKII